MHGRNCEEPLAVRLAVLASGSGTLCDAIAGAGIPISLVVVDRRCGAEQIALSHGVRCVIAERADFGEGFDRGEYSHSLANVLRDHGIDLVAMAGFGTILDADFFTEFGGVVLNTHPALLPSFPGWHAVRDALAYGVKVTGCTVHVAVPEVDAGPILAQEAVPVYEGDDEATLHERIKVVERRLYVETIRQVMERPHTRSTS